MKAMVIEDVFQLYKRIQNCLFYSFSWSSNFIYRASPVIKQATDGSKMPILILSLGIVGIAASSILHSDGEMLVTVTSAGWQGGYPINLSTPHKIYNSLLTPIGHNVLAPYQPSTLQNTSDIFLLNLDNFGWR